jgi:uncharacterized protein YccT (UPF0319 family)
MKAYLKGVRLYNQGLTDKNVMVDVIASLKKHIEITDDKVWTSLRRVGLTNDGHLNIESMESDIKWYNQNGYLAKIPTQEQYHDDQFVKSATTELDKNSKKEKSPQAKTKSETKKKK